MTEEPIGIQSPQTEGINRAEVEYTPNEIAGLKAMAPVFDVLAEAARTGDLKKVEDLATRFRDKIEDIEGSRVDTKDIPPLNMARTNRDVAFILGNIKALVAFGQTAEDIAALAKPQVDESK
jgi:hypothetical protein